MFGNHDFNKVPLAPPGTRVVLHSKPEQRKSWAFHGEKGYYIGPAPEHYRCVRCFIPRTQKERITDTVAFIPKVIPISHASIDDHLRKTVDDLVHLLTKKPGKISPTGPQSAQSALIKISKLLNSDTSPVIAPLQLPQESSQQSNTITDNTTHKTAKQSTTLPMDIQKINTPPSEGESHLHRSEGENALIGDRIKSSITPMPTATIPKHPSLYPVVPISQQQPSRFTKVLPTLQPKRRIQRVENQKIKQLLQEYKNVPKKTTRLRSPKPDKMHRRHVHRSPLTYIPIPKKIKSSRSSASHPMLLRKRYLHNKIPTYKHRAAEHLLAQCVSKLNHIFDEVGKKKSIDTLLKQNPLIWGSSLSNELGRLSQGVRDIEGNNALMFIKKSKIPPHKKVAYANMVCDHRPLKKEKYRVRLTIGGDVLEYLYDASSPAASLLESKLLMNSVISDSHKGARFMTIDLKDYFLQSFLLEPEYLRIHGKYFLPDIRQKYNINALIDSDGYVYCEVKRGIYGLKQAAKLARDQLIKHLAPYGYYPTLQEPNIWAHKTKPTKFCLCVDDFGIKYFSELDAQHLIKALQAAYEITINKEGNDFCGLKLNWNYDNGFVDVSMPKYVNKALEKLNHAPPPIPQHAPHKWVPITYGK